MNLNNILAFSDLAGDLNAKIKGFDMLCEQLSKLTDQENSQYLSDGHANTTSLSLRKMALLEVFDDRAKEVFDGVKEQASTNAALQNYLIQKVLQLKEKLKVNTSLQLHVISEFHQNLNGREARNICH